MKKFIALFVCAFVTFVFEGCAPVNNQPMYTTYEPAPSPAPAPKAQPRVYPKPAPKPAPAPVVKKKSDYEIVTDNIYPIPKALNVDNDLTIVSLTPVTYSSKNHCNEVYFFTSIVTPSSGYHSLVDISMSETKVNGGYFCKYFGSAVTYQVKPNPIVKEIVKYEDVVRKYEPER